ncbi:FlgD-like protein [Spirosoma oryzae]|uniref:FlgD-like protein n=1 Tax=Spirosoma oryzae TaxID=1469603 RepID=A0A2T0T343_9BACT|nr:C25 family cysteine peptidase [Spirosoma oryzae]PRY40053.1 FlgD-like protein [Spirosoma oryzae]
MHHTYLTFILLLITRFGWGQSPRAGNEWIVYTQSYLKIPVVQPGLYRITPADLQRAGWPVSTIDPTAIQLFHRGTEQAIFVAGQTDGRLDADDYIDFYGQGNDGAPDSLLYRPASAMPHPYYSLFSDTTAYFLTYRLDGKSGKRMASYTDSDETGLTAESWHWAEERRVFTQTYPTGTIYPLGANAGNGAILSSYDTGEGWTGPILRPADRYDQLVNLIDYASAAGVRPRASWLVVGRTPTPHRMAFSAGATAGSLRALGAVTYDDYATSRFDTELFSSDLSATGSVVLTAQPGETSEEASVSYLSLRYPQRISVPGQTNQWLQLQTDSTGRSLLDLTSLPASTPILDISNPDAVTLIGSNTTDHWRGIVRATQTGRSLFVSHQPRSVPTLLPVRFRQITPARHNYLIVTHPLLRQPVGTIADPVQTYAAYRASLAGGSYDTLTVNIGELFDQFSYGERHPLAIRRFAAYMLSGGAGPKFMFLIGQSRDPQSIRKNASGPLLDLIPNIGWPGSDLGLVEGLNGEPANVPALPIGRLNAIRSPSVLDYLAKVQAHELLDEPALWRKNSLHLSGGRTPAELQTFRSYVDDFKGVIEQSYVGSRVTTVSKRTNDPVEILQIADMVNKGTGMISMFGHSSLAVSDIDISFVSDDRLGYRNKGRYPFLFANGCAAGNFYFGRSTFGTDWILTPDRGAILFLAHTHIGFPFALKTYADQLYSLLADSQFVTRPVGLVQREAIRRYLRASNTIYTATTAQQMTLQGDPAVAVFPFAQPDFAFLPRSLRVTDSRGDSLTVRSDSVVLTGIVANYGRTTNRPLTVRIRRYTAAGQLVRDYRLAQAAPLYADTLRWTVPNDKTATGPAFFELLLDPDDRIPERIETNNKAEISSAGSLDALPFPPDVVAPTLDVAFDGQHISDDAIVAPQPRIDVLLQDDNSRLLRSDTTNLELYLQRPCANSPCPYERLSLRGPGTSWTAAGTDNAFRLQYQPATPLPDGTYTFAVRGSDLSGNQAAPYQIQFTVYNRSELRSVTAYPNPFSRQIRLSLVLTGQIPPARLTLRLYDVAGHAVRTVSIPGRIGLNEWTWDGNDDAGNPLPAGLYLYQIDATGLPTTTVPLSGRLIHSP